MPRKSTTRKISIDIVAQYMTAELDVLNQNANHSKDTLMNKVNFFLVLVTAIGGGLAYLLTLDHLLYIFTPIAGVVVFILVLMGINTLRQSLDLSASAITFYRRTGRIRKWYIEQDPTLEPYLPFNVADDLPKMSSSFINLRGAESILLLINSSLIGTLIGLSVFWILPRINLAYILLTGLAVFGLAWALQVKYVKTFMENWDKRQQKLGLIRFPEAVKTEEEFKKLRKKKG